MTQNSLFNKGTINDLFFKFVIKKNRVETIKTVKLNFIATI